MIHHPGLGAGTVSSDQAQRRLILLQRTEDLSRIRTRNDPNALQRHSFLLKSNRCSNTLLISHHQLQPQFLHLPLSRTQGVTSEQVQWAQVRHHSAEHSSCVCGTEESKED